METKIKEAKTFEEAVQQTISFVKGTVTYYAMEAFVESEAEKNKECSKCELYDLIMFNSVPKIKELFHCLSQEIKNKVDTDCIIRELHMIAWEAMCIFNILNFRSLDFSGTVQRMISIYRKKNADYGNSFDQSLDEDGLLVAKIRIGDKVRRFLSLTKEGAKEAQVKDESIADTLLDLANYCVMTIVYINNHVNKEHRYE